MRKICVVGTINVDIVAEVPVLPTPGVPTRVTSLSAQPGGRGANVAIALSRLGARSYLLGSVGRDSYGPKVVRAIENEGVVCAHVGTSDAVDTGRQHTTIDQDGEMTTLVSIGANARLSALDVRRAWPELETCDLVVLQSDVPDEALLEAARLASGARKRIVLNIHPARRLPEALLRKCDLVVLNSTDAGLLLGAHASTSPEELALRLLRHGPNRVALTLGDRGSIVCVGTGLTRRPSFSVEEADQRGAAAAFLAGLALSWAEGQSLEDAIVFASAAGALAASRRGLHSSLPDRDDVEVLAGTSWLGMHGLGMHGLGNAV